MDRYVVVTETKLSNFTATVNHMIKQGYVPHGSLVVKTVMDNLIGIPIFMFIQPMVWVESGESPA